MFFKQRPSFSPEQEQAILAAIATAEEGCLAEIRVHLDGKRNFDAFKRAKRIFTRLKMDETAQRNGILIYVVPKSHKYVVLGDIGIHEKVGDEFWEHVSSAMREEFAQDNLSQGIINAITICGEKLKKYFPIIDGEGNDNELPDEISRS
jgi:uncharacterized membrane protein